MGKKCFFLANENTSIDINNSIYEETIMCLVDAYVHFRENYFIERPKFIKKITNEYLMNCFYRICDMIIDGRDPETLQIETDIMINNSRNYPPEIANCLLFMKESLPALQENKFSKLDRIVYEYGNKNVENYVYSNYNKYFK